MCTYQSDTPGTFQTVTDGTFHSAMSGTFQSDTGGTSIPLLSGNLQCGEGSGCGERLY